MTGRTATRGVAMHIITLYIWHTLIAWGWSRLSDLICHHCSTVDSSHCALSGTGAPRRRAAVRLRRCAAAPVVYTGYYLSERVHALHTISDTATQYMVPVRTTHVASILNVDRRRAPPLRPRAGGRAAPASVSLSVLAVTVAVMPAQARRRHVRLPYVLRAPGGSAGARRAPLSDCTCGLTATVARACPPVPRPASRAGDSSRASAPPARAAITRTPRAS